MLYDYKEEAGDTMKKGFFFPLMFVLAFFLFCCAQEQTEKKEIVAKINDYELTLKEFDDQLAAELELDKDFKLTKEAKREFLEQLIRKELLIQEATKLELDRREKFIRAIERYWESTLIRDLVELKGKEFSQRTYVSQEEIEARYEELKKSEGELPLLQEIQKKIAEELKEQKKREKLTAWIIDLRRNAKIEIDSELLYKD